MLVTERSGVQTQLRTFFNVKYQGLRRISDGLFRLVMQIQVGNGILQCGNGILRCGNGILQCGNGILQYDNGKLQRTVMGFIRKTRLHSIECTVWIGEFAVQKSGVEFGKFLYRVLRELKRKWNRNHLITLFQNVMSAIRVAAITLHNIRRFCR